MSTGNNHTDGLKDQHHSDIIQDLNELISDVDIPTYSGVPSAVTDKSPLVTKAAEFESYTKDQNNRLLDSEQNTQDHEESELLKQPVYNLRLILPACWLGSFLAAMDGTVVANIMNGIAGGFGQEDLKPWIATSYLLTNSAFQPLYGRVSDIIAISGIGGGGLGAMSSIIVSDIVSLEDRGLFQGYANLNYAAGQMIGAPLGALCLDTIGWRWMFGIQVPAVSICMLLAYLNINIHLPNTGLTRKNLQRIDFGGSLTLVTSITAFLLLLSTDISKIILSIILFVSLSSFIYIEKYVAKEEILPLKLLQGLAGSSGFISFSLTFAVYVVIFFVPSYVQILQNKTVQTSGKFLILNTISVSFGSLFAGYILKRINADVKKIGLWITLFGSLLLSSSVIFLWIIVKYQAPYSDQWKAPLSIILLLIGFAFGSTLVAILVVVVAIVGKEGQASATGLNYLFRSTAQVLAVGISMSIYEKAISKDLWSLLKPLNNGSYIYQELLKNADFLKNSEIIDHSLLFKILAVYQTALVDSVYPAIAMSIFGVILASWLTLKYGL
ncbi:hypothetical protein WICMUC_003145 [Wickerhamomyces mucosus]|uniref:Major facilitator superfamily (MFS) profile domain-containing protein n=1 Tax=Wickerhamomyces mucosus TaxID=1378264 RepID=A0A9P8TDD1_9ASCO|nr:hypothetical protein WICMUC_003145 [Wickerhamomyces mucosus]